MNQEQLARFKKYLKDKLIELSSEDGEFELGEWSAYEHMDKVLWLMTGDSDDGDQEKLLCHYSSERKI